ncbi:hypothetical protein ACFQU1_12300 [Chelatococcus sp. GCM10030263]|uniref:hypothetical protein n=1 Tax=Chelatococcus sp. GCM10030263 TaxID=3273387 RepID=UPI00360AEEC1
MRSNGATLASSVFVIWPGLRLPSSAERGLRYRLVLIALCRALDQQNDAADEKGHAGEKRRNEGFPHRRDKRNQDDHEQRQAAWRGSER